MAFTQPFTGLRNESRRDEDIWAVFRALRDARSRFGLKPAHIQTLQALLSFLRPGQGETVFASNLEICRRIGGIDERTLRRHIDRFVELGFIARQDSPNRKRYRVRSSEGLVLSFGLSVSPLLARGTELNAAAEAVEHERRDQIFLRKQILTRLARIDELTPDCVCAQAARKALRRKLCGDEYRDLLTEIQECLQQLSTVVDMPVAEHLSGNDGQIVRHLSKSEKEDNDIEPASEIAAPDIGLLTSVCVEATLFTPEPLRNWRDVASHAQTLAPMMGIKPARFENACRRIGVERAASAVFILLQMGGRIRNLAAYFHSLTLGSKARSFNPSRLLYRLAAQTAQPA